MLLYRPRVGYMQKSDIELTFIIFKPTYFRLTEHGEKIKDERI